MNIADILKDIPHELRAQAKSEASFDYVRDYVSRLELQSLAHAQRGDYTTAALLSAALLALGALDTDTAQDSIMLAAKSSERWDERRKAGKAR